MIAGQQSLSVVVVTYEWPGALDIVLRALWEAGDDVTVLVADDGSGPETLAVVERWRRTYGERLAHVWQPDEGYRRARLLNLAARKARGNYLVFLDGDCIPRRRFVEAVRRAALPGWFLAGKRIDLGERLSRRVLEEQLPVWRWSVPRWLLRVPRDLRRPGLLLPLRDRRRPWRSDRPDFAPPFEGYGFFLGLAREDFERVNGFDTRFVGWGEEDVDLAVRLRRSGLRCGWPGPDSTLVHLWHRRRKADGRPNLPLLQETRESTRIEAVEGLREVAEEEPVR